MIETTTKTVFIGSHGKHYDSKCDAAQSLAGEELKQVWDGADVLILKTLSNADRIIGVLQRYLENVK